jgi:hypothetical protein
VDRPPWPPLSGAAGTTDGPLPPELDPRSHRPSDFRAIAVVVVVVAILAVLLPVGLYFETNAGGGTSSPIPIGTAFALALPEELTCNSTLATLNACVTAGDSLYAVQVEVSTISFDDVIFEVQSSDYTIFENAGIGSFALITPAGEAVAYSEISAYAGLTMPTTWAHYASGYSGGSSLTSTVIAILVDLGQTTPVTGLYLVAIGANGCTGTTLPLSLS